MRQSYGRDYCMMRPFKNEVLSRRIKQVAKIKGLDQKIIQKETEIILRKMIKEQ